VSAAARIPSLRDEREMWAYEIMACLECGIHFEDFRPFATPDDQRECPECNATNSTPARHVPSCRVKVH
jgi:hypothetical protein